MIKYKASKRHWGDPEITKVEVERETPSSVWINGQRFAKKSQWDNYFDSFSEAKDFLLDIANSKIESAEHGLSVAKEYLEKAESLLEEA